MHLEVRISSQHVLNRHQRAPIAERQPLFVFALVIFFTAFEVFFIGGVLIAATWILDELAGWTILVGNLLATVAMLAYFFASHRALARRLTEAWVEED